MIYLITSRYEEYSTEVKEVIESRNDIQLAKGKDFTAWYNSVKETDEFTQLDTETNVVENLFDRELYVVQVGSQDGEQQWIFDIPRLATAKLRALKSYLVDDSLYKICHNAMFEYTIIKWAFDIRINRMRDTFLMSKILSTGIDHQPIFNSKSSKPLGYHSLAGCMYRFLNITSMDKTQQTSYTGDPLNIEQIDYAATDVVPLYELHKAMQVEVDKWDLENVVRLECAMIRPLGDGMTWNWYLNKDEWQINIDDQYKLVNDLTNVLHDMIRDEFYDDCLKLGFIQGEDEYAFNWRGRNIKQAILQMVYPEMPVTCTTIRDYKEYLKALYENEESTEDPQYLEMLLAKNYEVLELELIKNYDRELKEELCIFTPKDEVLINFKSPVQKLQFFQLIKPSLQNTDKKALSKMRHPIVKKYNELGKALKLYQSYGKNYLEAVDSDGMLRIPKVTQILHTGRTSMKLYQLLPGDNKYRNPFYLKDDWVGVGADYASQELCVMATFAGDETMLNAIKLGKDLHSVGAAALFPKEWAAAGEDPKCFGKPKTGAGKAIRVKIKALNFGEVYSTSVY